MKNSEQLEYSIREKLYEFVETPEIHAQSTEAFYIWNNNPDSIIVYNDEDDLNDELFAKFLDWFIFDFKSFDKGKRIIEIFKNKFSENLEQEELQVLNDWSGSTRSWYEIQDIVPGETCKLKDLFSGNEIIVHDSIVSNQLKVTDIISARPVRTIDKNYFFSLVSVYPLILKPVILEFYETNFRGYSRDYPEELSSEDFLKDIGYLLGNYIEDVINHPFYLTPEGEEFLVASSVYSLKKRDQAANVLKNDKHFSLLNDTADDLIIYRLNMPGDNVMDVHVEIEEKQLIVNTNSMNTMNKVKSFIEELLGDLIQHKKDSTKKFNELSKNSSKITFKLPKGVRSKKQFDSQLDEYYTKWIDTPLERLDGLSPRKAIITPDGRQKLELILKDLEALYEDARKAGEPYYEVSKLREELQKTMI